MTDPKQIGELEIKLSCNADEVAAAFDRMGREIDYAAAALEDFRTAYKALPWFIRLRLNFSAELQAFMSGKKTPDANV